MYASRSLKLCSKDCLCLFVCATGATDTETGQIARERCVDGCRVCVDACPSHAIYLVIQRYLEPPPKNPVIAELMMRMCERKTYQEGIANAIVEKDPGPGISRLAKAPARSCCIPAEDCAREAGYMTPQCSTTQKLLERIGQETDGDIRRIGRQLMEQIQHQA